VDLSFRFDAWYRRLPSSPRDAGRVHAVVVRPARGRRATPEAVRVTPEGGIEGDRWAADEQRRPGNQVSLINVHVVRSLAGGDLSRTALSGDNLQVDLDLSEENLPAGTLLRVGDAVLEVSSDPHRPCRLFVERFGATGAKKVARANRRGRRGRGVLCRVRAGGTIRVGDEIRVERPDAARRADARA
jgi:MOSC domain-containing protein YiiM